jgi:hypothetical protein
MSEPNYNETVVLPFLEKKCKDLLSVNLVLEARLLAEMERCKGLQAIIDTLQAKIDSAKKKKKAGEEPVSGDGETY